MKLTDALAQFRDPYLQVGGRCRHDGRRGPRKYIGEQLALAESGATPAGGAGRSRRSSRPRAAEAAGATSLRGQVFAASVAPEAAEGEKDPVLDAPRFPHRHGPRASRRRSRPVTVPASKESSRRGTSSADVNKADGRQNASTPRPGRNRSRERPGSCPLAARPQPRPAQTLIRRPVLR